MMIIIILAQKVLLSGIHHMLPSQTEASGKTFPLAQILQ